MALSFKTIAFLALTSTLVTADPFPKRGLPANDGVPIWQFGGKWDGRPSQVNWQYNWDSTTNQKQTFAEFVPMLWSPAADHTNDWNANVNWWLSNGGSGHLLGFNEPDLAQQANLSPGAAASAYRQWITPYNNRASLGSPAVTNGGWDWLNQFMSQCGDCGIDFIAVHWYNDWSLFGDFQNWVNRVCSLGKQVWITEFQALGSVDQQSNFLSKAIPWLDSNSCVYRYAYFGTANNGKVLLNGNGPALSALGVQYTYAPY